MKSKFNEALILFQNGKLNEAKNTFANTYLAESGLVLDFNKLSS